MQNNGGVIGPALHLLDVEVDGRRCDVEVVAGRVTRIGTSLRGADQTMLGYGASLLPGLHDHHIHLLAEAAAPDSVDVSRGLEVLRDAGPRNGWVRAVGCDSDPDRADLDRVRADVSIRVQHRGGSLWALNSAAIAAVGLDEADVDGVERDASGRPTGRLWRLDSWLAARIPQAAPDLRALGTRLAASGITGVTDATPELSVESQRLLCALPQRVTLLAVQPGRFPAGPRKIVVSDHDLPGPDKVAQMIAEARTTGRAVAIHAVTRAALVVTLAAFDDVGAVDGDRVEHAAVVPPDAATAMRRLNLTVVTQPSLVERRGDDYLDRSDPFDVPYLWPFRSLLDAGVRTVASSDAPYGDPDPWATMRSARDRRTASGRVLGPQERVPPSVSLAGFLSRPLDSGGPPRQVEVGARADLVLLDAPLATVLADPSADRVRVTIIGGDIVYTSGS
jgi:predicted amidohydrolase YtcJ